jgi:hypothetical protein
MIYELLISCHFLIIYAKKTITAGVLKIFKKCMSQIEHQPPCSVLTTVVRCPNRACADMLKDMAARSAAVT